MPMSRIGLFQQSDITLHSSFTDLVLLQEHQSLLTTEHLCIPHFHSLNSHSMNCSNTVVICADGSHHATMSFYTSTYGGEKPICIQNRNHTWENEFSSLFQVSHMWCDPILPCLITAVSRYHEQKQTVFCGVLQSKHYMGC